MSGGKVAVSSVSFTLPLSCQICLGKVREPVTCSNQHVFCSSCMNVWLDRNSRCPSCRVEISPQSPVKRIIGGAIEGGSTSSVSRFTSRELRRARYELILKEYEDEVQQLESGNEKLECENNLLKEQLQSLKQVKMERNTGDEYFTYPKSCKRCAGIKDVDVLLDMTKKLQDATKTYSKTKKELTEVKKINEVLLKSNDDLKRTNLRIREEVAVRSPMKFSRLTVAALESRLEASEKQVTQLQKALQKNDHYTEQLENEVANLKSDKKKEKVDEKQLHNPILVSILNEPQTESSSSLETTRTTNTPSSKLKSLTLVTPEHKNVVASDADTTLYDSENLSQQENSMFSFSTDKSTTIRRLKFESTNEASLTQQTKCKNTDLLTIKDAFDLALDLSQTWSDEPTENSPLDGMSDNGFMLSTNPPLTLNESVNSASQSSIDDEILQSWEAPNGAMMKTTIDAGGSRITMSHLSESEKDAFSRPSSAPSRTFLLSGSKFSALRPLDSASHSNSNDFQPVKCISPLHGYSKLTKENARSPLQLVSPDEVVSPKNWVSNEVEEPNRRELLSRVNILKRNTSLTKQTSCTNNFAQTSVGENRRKQKLSQKRTGEVLIQDVLKSPKF